MKILLLILLIFLSNCKLNSVDKNHGVPFLQQKQDLLTINHSNKNDILETLGPPSTKSTFDNDVWIYIERKITRGKLLNLGKNILVKNNVLLVEIDETGILVKKEFFDLKDMNKLKFSKNKTTGVKRKNNFIYDFLSSLRRKINDPLGKRK